MLPFSPEVFFSTLDFYNRSIWPAQILALLLGAVAIGTTIRPVRHSRRITAAILAGSWMYCGMAYHFGHFAPLNFWDYPIGILFLVQGILILWTGFWRDRFMARRNEARSARAGIAIMTYALVGHPVLGFVIGRSLTEATVFAATPVPTILFTLGVLSLPATGGTWTIWIIPVLLSLVEAAMALVLPVPEYWSLLPVVAVSLFCFAMHPNRYRPHL